jgi:hypothetical protein
MKSEPQINSTLSGYPFSNGLLLKSISEIDKKEVSEEWMLPVETAQVFYANYPLLMNDFPQLKEANLLNKIPRLKKLKGNQRKKEIERIIDRWLIKHSAYISESQANQELVNEKIKVSTLKTKGFRPPNYGRAVVYSIEENLKILGVSEELGESPTDAGLLDVKGVGVAPNRSPAFGTHSNGLVGLHGSLRELVFEQLIYNVFRLENSIHNTLPIYALIELGFDIKLKNWVNVKDENGKEKKELNDQGCFPSATVVRRAHNRPPGGGDLPKYGSHSQIAKIDIEFMIRQYGISSSNGATNIYITPTENDFIVKYAEEVIPIPKGVIRETLLKVSHYSGEALEFDGINIQITEEPMNDSFQATLVDFGNYVLREDFTNPVLSLVIDRVLRWGGAVWPKDKMYQRPNPQNRIPFKLWGEKGPACNFDDDMPKLSFDSFKTVCNHYANGKLSKSEVLQCVDKYLETAFPKITSTKEP